jgi:hypothetical protein
MVGSGSGIKHPGSATLPLVLEEAFFVVYLPYFLNWLQEYLFMLG